MNARLLPLGVLALLAACATGKEQQVSPEPPPVQQAKAPPQTREQRVEQAQQDSMKAFERARAAQEQANRLQREAADAQQRADNAQRQFAEAEQRLEEARRDAQRKSAEAITAQQQARQEAERAQATAAESQRLALDLQRNRITVVGELAAIGPDTLIIRGPDPQPLRLGLGERTVVTIGGQRVSPEELIAGSEVRATYQILEGRPVALEIDATPAPAPAPAPVP